jgi:ABC-type glycerol-3-phosphate transport system substrate-binding protein
MKKMLGLAAAIAAAATLAGCGGSDQYVTVTGATTISKGQELTDLQRALQEGAITQSEYNTLRERILRRPN